MKIINNERNEQFEVHEGDYMAELVYRKRGDKLFIMHTGVPDALGGKGIATALAKHALRYALENDFEPVVYCPFVRSYMAKHPNWKVEVMR